MPAKQNPKKAGDNKAPSAEKTQPKATEKQAAPKATEKQAAPKATEKQAAPKATEKQAAPKATVNKAAPADKKEASKATTKVAQPPKAKNPADKAASAVKKATGAPKTDAKKKVAPTGDKKAKATPQDAKKGAAKVATSRVVKKSSMAIKENKTKRRAALRKKRATKVPKQPKPDQPKAAEDKNKDKKSKKTKKEVKKGAKEAKAKALTVQKALKKGKSSLQKKKIRTDIRFRRPLTLVDAKNPQYPRRSVPKKPLHHAYSIVKFPLVTETAMKFIEENNTICFVTELRVNKNTIRQAVRKLYDIKAAKIRTLITPLGKKKAFVRLVKEQDALDVANKIGIF